jgi:membrane protein YqaA with SNARE-associated domain
MLATVLKTVEAGTWSVLQRTGSSPAYPLLVGGIAFAFTVSMLIPFASVLIGSILLRRERWLAIVFLSSLGSTLGGLLLYLIFHHWGWSQIATAYPDLIQSKAWADATR